MINQDNKKRIASFSKGLSIITLISIIFSYIGIAMIVVCMAIIPFITKNISIEENTLNIFNEKIEFYLTKEEILTVKHNGELVENFTFEELGANYIIEVLQNLSSSRITIYLEVIFIFSIIEMILLIIILTKIRKLFKGISIQKTPFIKEAPEYIKFVAYILIGLVVFDVVTLIASSLIIGMDISISINISYILFIIVLFLLSFIFRYGYELENKGE